MDLIVGLPGETLTDFQYTMQEIEKLRPDSITIHTLVIKRASKLREEQSAQMEQGLSLIHIYYSLTSSFIKSATA